MVFLDFIQNPALQFVKWCWMILDQWSPCMTKFTCVISAMVVKQSGFDLAKGSAILIAVAFGSEFWSAQICATRSFLVSLLLAAAVTFCCSPPLLLGMWPLQVGNPLWNAEHWKTKCDYSCKGWSTVVVWMSYFMLCLCSGWTLIISFGCWFLYTVCSCCPHPLQKLPCDGTLQNPSYLHSWGVAGRQPNLLGIGQQWTMLVPILVDPCGVLLGSMGKAKSPPGWGCLVKSQPAVLMKSWGRRSSCSHVKYMNYMTIIYVYDLYCFIT